MCLCVVCVCICVYKERFLVDIWVDPLSQNKKKCLFCFVLFCYSPRFIPSRSNLTLFFSQKNQEKRKKKKKRKKKGGCEVKVEEADV